MALCLSSSGSVTRLRCVGEGLEQGLDNGFTALMRVVAPALVARDVGVRAVGHERLDIRIGERTGHETGPAKGRDERCARASPDTDVLVFGHSHIPWETTTSTGLRLLNPGSPTDRRPQPWCTYLTATAADGGLRDVRLHRQPRPDGSTFAQAQGQGRPC
ncbi:hypothetical protein BH20ACT6_BH20ACT6_25000 [soil metagenome]